MANHSYKYEPKNKFTQWLDNRLPVIRFFNENFTFFPTPINLNLLWTLGAILMLVLIIQIVTGIALAMHYVPNTKDAFESVEKIMRDVNYGYLLRYIHANGASMFFIAVYIHMFRGLYYGSYRAPREMLWIVGVIIFLIMMATAFLGYVLPWGQMSFWGATVITNLFSAIPVVGESIVQWLWGGYGVDQPTLNRFFVLHFLLPFVLLAIVMVHVIALHIPGNNNPTGLDVKNTQKETLPFHPFYTVKDLMAVAFFVILFALMVFFHPNYLGHPDNYIEANPLQTPAHIVPEWYFLPFYAILRAIPDKLMGVMAMFGSIAILFVLPWLDRSSVRSGQYRPLFKGFFLLFMMNAVMLGFAGANPPEGLWLVLSRIGVVYYFSYFLVILPVLSVIEKPTAMPNSIEEAFNQQHPKTQHSSKTNS